MTNTILLADDSVTIQKVIELTFMDQDYEVVAVGDGDEALERLEEIDPDVVIADVHMPGASGYDVAKRSKQLHPRSPVLVLVGTFEPFDEGDVEAAGADGYLKKPFDSQELLQRVDELLAGREEEGEAPEEAEAAAGDRIAADEPLGAGAGRQAPSRLESEAAAWTPPAIPTGADDRGAPSAAPWAEEETGPWVAPAAADEGERVEAEGAFGEEEPTADETVDRRGDREPAAAETSFDPGALDAAEERGIDAGDAGAAPVGDDTTWVPDWQAAPAAARADEPADETAAGAVPAWEAADEPFPGLSRPPAPPSPPPASAEPRAAAAPAGRLSDDDVDRVARRVAELLGDQVVREVAWEVVPDLAEVVIKDRLRELESQLD